MKISAKLFLLLLLHSTLAKIYDIPDALLERGSSFWYNHGRQELRDALKKPIINKVAKNVIIFLGDGLGPTAATAGRIFKGQSKGRAGEEGYLSWERFPNSAMIKTYTIDRQVADSAATATAYLGGVKANFYTAGVTGNVQKSDCEASLAKENHVISVLEWAQIAGKDTGFVTTTRVTHATPSALYAHTAQRNWECDEKMKTPEDIEDSKGCKDIARQLVEDVPGKYIHVILAGGRRQMGSALPTDDGSSCLRNDSRNLSEEWVYEKRGRGLRAEYVKCKNELQKLDLKNTDHILGLFSGSHLPYEYNRVRNASLSCAPSLEEMTEAAITRLKRNDRGFFLLVEGGRIDHALHDTKTRLAMDEILAFDKAIEKAMTLLDPKDTLMIVTADHSHGMTLNGYPVRGNDILGTTTYDHVLDNMPYTTLTFASGIGTNFTYNGTHVLRSNVTNIDTTSADYISQAAIPTEDGYEMHGGEDVALFARGPMAHLFHRLHEQSYIAHVMGYAACIGPYKDECPRHDFPIDVKPDDCYSFSASINYMPSSLTIALPALLYKFL